MPADSTASRGQPSPEMLLCTKTFFHAHGRRLRELAPDLEVVTLEAEDASTKGDRDERRDGVTIAFFSKDAFPTQAATLFAAANAAPRLRWFHTMSAGLEGPAFDQLRRRGVVVTRSAGASAPAMAETVMFYLHALGRGVRELVAGYESRAWQWSEWRELRGQSIAVLGYGPVGQRVVDLALAYEMEPTVLRRRVVGDEPCRVRPLDELESAVAESDVVVVALPLTDQTRGLVSRPVLAAMKPGSLLINVARGPIVDQQAVVDFLIAGHLGGAGVDVADPEPLDPESPLWEMPNVIITPHNSGASVAGAERVVDIFLLHLERYLSDPIGFVAAELAAEQRRTSIHDT